MPLTITPYADDDDLLAAVRSTGAARIRVTRPAATRIVLGRSSKPERELNLPAVEAAGIAVQRRRGGGCTVLLDPGNLVIAVVLPIPGFGAIDTWFGRLSAWLCHELDRVGVPGVERQGVSDLAIDGKKIAGSCIFRTRDLLYYSTTLLVEADLALIQHVLAHPPREPDYRSGRTHREFLARLADLHPELTTAGLLDRLRPQATPERLATFTA